MNPTLFTIGPFNVYTFGFFLSLSFILSTFIIWKYGREELKEEIYLDTFLYVSIIALIAARVVYIIFHYDDFGLNILRYIVVRETPGISLLGGATFGAIFLYYYSLKKKYNFWHLADLFSFAASLALSLAKIGEQLGGASFGKKTIFPLAVKIIGQSGKYHPVEIYEAILFFALTCVLFFLYKRTERLKWPQGLVFYVFISGIALVTFLLEFLKVQSVYLYMLSIRQIIVLIMLIVVIKPLWTRIKIIRSKHQ